MMKHTLWLALALAASPAWATYKCIQPSGQTVYQQAPCAANDTKGEYSTSESRERERVERERQRRQQLDAEKKAVQDKQAQERRQAEAAAQDLRNREQAIQRAAFEKRKAELLAVPDAVPAKSVIAQNIVKCETAVREKLKDPMSAVFEQSKRVGRTVAIDESEQLVARVTYSTQVNAKNSFGAYTGKKLWTCSFDGDKSLLSAVPFEMAQ